MNVLSTGLTTALLDIDSRRCLSRQSDPDATLFSEERFPIKNSIPSKNAFKPKKLRLFDDKSEDYVHSQIKQNIRNNSNSNKNIGNNSSLFRGDSGGCNSKLEKEQDFGSIKRSYEVRSTRASEEVRKFKRLFQKNMPSLMVSEEGRFHKLFY